MKKMIICFVITIFLIGCSKQSNQEVQTPQQTSTKADCSINGYDCWAIIQKVVETPISYEDTENGIKGVCKNSTLEAKGVSITDCDMYHDGGSKIFILSNGITIFRNHELFSSEQGYITVSWPDKKSFTFNKKGRLVRQTSGISE